MKRGGRKKNTAGKQNWKDTQEDEEEDCSHGCRSARLRFFFGIYLFKCWQEDYAAL